MKALKFRTIFLGLLLALGIFYFTAFVHTLLDMLTQIRLNKPLNAYLLWGYSPMIVSGIYIGFARVREKILNGALVGVIYYFILWLIGEVLIPVPRFDHSVRPLSFGLELALNGSVCLIVAWLTHTVLKKRSREIN